MVQVLENVLSKKANMQIIPKQRPKVIGEPGNETIHYTDLLIPPQMNRRLLNRCDVGIGPNPPGLSNHDVEDKIYETNLRKDLYMRFAGNKPISVVTDRFHEIDPNIIVEHAKVITGTQPIIRYFRNNESLQINCPIDSRFKGMNFVINTGDYGVYGGSGHNAISYGISWFNKTCANWTLFLDKQLRNSLGRIFHRGTSGLEDSLTDMTDFLYELNDHIEESKDRDFTASELDRYFTRYQSKGLTKRIGAQILSENPVGMSCFDLSYRLTELCQDSELSDVTRAKIEYLAGEVILCYDDIKNDLCRPMQTANDMNFAPRKNASYRHGQNHYVSLN